MNGYHTMDAGWWVLMSIIWIALIALVVWAVVHLFPSRGGRVDDEDAKQILDRRLANGEIDTQTYDELRGRLDKSALAGGR
jgi:putative membrane protein